jgi:hypothetical protein
MGVTVGYVDHDVGDDVSVVARHDGCVKVHTLSIGSNWAGYKNFIETDRVEDLGQRVAEHPGLHGKQDASAVGHVDSERASMCRSLPKI